MRFRKVVTSVLIASTLLLSVPVLAAPVPDSGMLQGDGGGFGGDAGPNLFAWIVGLAALTVAVVAVADASKSP